ncbi:AbrB/MazE/SpoVT family DNA-binding domain-containing protein [Paenibacillus pinistramenti]|uniref:AbrB/MazE/SpoVT family DNA-binding domain-containing protein n=1 Tax=Paenibacillus pinistramenti TaxID=1768003 RepID=UPI0011084F28|nr:AbrB/MazE/SpoVT family DNA-binding domain-containing protein [Paenibacillus pinistramenti]
MHQRKDNSHGFGHGKVLGTTSMGERGQIVIPREAREELDIQPGEKFIVFGNKRKGAVILVKAEMFNRFADFFMSASKKFESMAQAIFDKSTPVSEEDENEPEVAEKE